MPYTVAWDEASPSGSVNANTIDTEIQNTKLALRERLEQVIEDFADDTVETKRLVEGSARPLQGTEEARPEEAEFKGQMYFSEDTGRTFVGKEDLTWGDVTADVPTFPRGFIIDAGSSEFNEEGDTKAERVRKAIAAAAASGGTVNTVYIPKDLWGYVADGDFNSSMFNATILLLREGSVTPWYDPVAYGADVTGGVDSAACIAAAVGNAKAPTSPGVRVVAFTVAGNYRNDSNIDQGDKIVGLIEFPGINHTGTGEFTGNWKWIFDGVVTIESGDAADRPAEGARAGVLWFNIDTGLLDLWEAVEEEWVTLNNILDIPAGLKAFTYNADSASGSRAATVEIVKILVVKLTGEAGVGGSIVLDLDETQFDGEYNVANIVAVVGNEIERVGSSGSVSGYWQIKLNSTDNTVTVECNGGAQTVEISLTMYFSA